LNGAVFWIAIRKEIGWSQRAAAELGHRFLLIAASAIGRIAA
jgi:hypothetical protein